MLNVSIARTGLKSSYTHNLYKTQNLCTCMQDAQIYNELCTVDLLKFNAEELIIFFKMLW